jgi:hypothetical protein
MTSGEVKPVVTLAALYGSGESVIGPRGPSGSACRFSTAKSPDTGLGAGA